MDMNMNNTNNIATQKKFDIFDTVNVDSRFKNNKFTIKILFFIAKNNMDYLQIIPKSCIKALINKGIVTQNEEKMLIECIEKQIFQDSFDSNLCFL